MSSMPYFNIKHNFYAVLSVYILRKSTWSFYRLSS